jgi:hypothetical protein
MKKLLLTLCAPFVVALPIVFACAMPALAQGQCLSNREIQAALASGEIQPVASVLANAGVGRDETLVSVKVCKEGGGLVYVVAVIGPDGNPRNLTLPAGN